ncbi:MAG TPA: RDD family protein [Thauera phenylacetica]|nr:RDD family protein [Thauera phenylacetica]
MTRSKSRAGKAAADGARAVPHPPQDASDRTDRAAHPTADRPSAELAGLRRRLASMLYESMLLLGVLALTFLVPYLMLGIAAEFAPPGWLLWLHVFGVLGVYFVWYWRRGGQTLAMQTWQLKIVTGADGRIASAARCWLRYALAWPSVLLGGIGLAWALVDRDRQFLHDRLAGTCIVLLPVVAKG